MSLPYELGPDRIIDGPGTAPQPKKGLKKLIGGGDEGRCRQMLSGSWEVTNREEALNTAHELLTYAGDAGYRALRPALTDLVQLPTDTVGWDTARALRMLWMAHGAGYITEEDAEPLVRGALEVTRQVYSSWREYADGFIVGRTQWTGMIDEGLSSTSVAWRPR